MEYSFVSLGPTLRVIALIMVFAVALVGLGIAIVLAALPGRIAAERDHPQAAAINVCGWVGLPTGFFWIVALVWAFLKPQATQEAPAAEGGTERALTDQIARLEAAVTLLEQRRKGARS